MGCRRGQRRRAPTSSSSSELSAGHFPLTRSRRGRSRVTSSHHGSVPTSGSAVFTFDSTPNRPRITAYFTVVFHEESQAEDTRTQPGGLGAISAPSSSLELNFENAPRQVANEQICRAQDVMMVDPGSSVQNTTQAGDLPDIGWCRIIEEPPDD